MNAQAVRQFQNLPHVDDDMAEIKTPADMVFRAQVQLDLIEEGELEATALERKRLQKFVQRWRGHA